MTVKERTRRPAVGARRAGYLVSVVINGLLLTGIHGLPGWRSVPFLAGETGQVLGASPSRWWSAWSPALPASGTTPSGSPRSAGW